jgi:5-dehydro-2-deoxygluconokinase
MKEIGYDRPLFVQPFDHRGSFTKTYFGFKGLPKIDAAEEQHLQVSEAKTVIYRGLLKAIDMGVARHTVGILVDAQFGAHIIADAKSKGIPAAVCVEKSGQNVFDFEYGPRWADHIRFIGPDIVKVLVRFHPADDATANYAQMARLKLLSDYIHSTDDYYLIFELLVPAVTDDEKQAGDRYDTELRPRRMVEAIKMIQDFGIEPDIWKIEGLDRREDAEEVATQVRSNDERKRAGCIILGRGSNKEKVHEWLEIAAPVPGFIGFAVGRTNFSDPLKRFLENRNEEDVAIEAIARNYKECVDIWQKARGSS